MACRTAASRARLYSWRFSFARPQAGPAGDDKLHPGRTRPTFPATGGRRPAVGACRARHHSCRHTASCDRLSVVRPAAEAVAPFISDPSFGTLNGELCAGGRARSPATAGLVRPAQERLHVVVCPGDQAVDVDGVCVDGTRNPPGKHKLPSDLGSGAQPSLRSLTNAEFYE